MTKKQFFTAILILAGSVAKQYDATAFPNTITLADLGNQVEVHLASHNFDWLDQTAQELRNPDVRLIGGNSQLFQFYGAVASYEDGIAPGNTREMPFDTKRQMLEQWLSAKPQSLAAHIALAQLWVFYGWNGRGEAYTDKVTAEQWRLLASGMEKASSYCKGVDGRSDPHMYYLRMEISKGTSSPRRVRDELYVSAIKAYPTYFHFYRQRANDLQEKWAGQKGELQAYVASLVRSPGGESGLVAYSYAAYNLMLNIDRSSLYDSTGLTWPLVRSAYATRQQRYGLRSRDWNALCNFAVAAQDRSAAKEALVKIGQDWDPAIWKERKYFDSAVAWIMWEPKHS
jgi:hypothetical protein